jgi:hypothetical protein
VNNSVSVTGVNITCDKGLAFCGIDVWWVPNDTDRCETTCNLS